MKQNIVEILRASGCSFFRIMPRRLAFAALCATTLTAGMAQGVKIESFSAEMLASGLKERRIELCGFERGASGWGVGGAESVEIWDEEPRTGEACLRIVKAKSAGSVELMRRFLVHENFRSIGLHVWVGPRDKPPSLDAVIRNERGTLKTVAMARDDDLGEDVDELLAQIEGRWIRFSLFMADVWPEPSDEPFHAWLRSLKPDPIFLEAIRIRPDAKNDEVIVDDMVAVLSDKAAGQPLYMTAEFDDSGDKPAFEVVVYNIGKAGAKRRAAPLRVAIEARDLDTPRWNARTNVLAETAEPAAGDTDAVPSAGARVELDSPLPAGAYLVYARLQEEAKDKDKLAYPTRHTALLFAIGGTGEAERTIEDFDAVSGVDDWLVELDRARDEDVRLANARAGGRVALDAGIVDEAGEGRCLRIFSKSGRANEVLWAPAQLSAAAKKLILRVKTVKGGAGRELVAHVAGRNGDIAEYSAALGNSGGAWRDVEFMLCSGHDNAPLSLLGFSLRGGESEALIGGMSEIFAGDPAAFQASFSAGAPRVMLGVHKFAEMFRSIESRHYNRIPDYWRGNEVYFEVPTGRETTVAVSVRNPAGELSYRLTGSGTNVLASGAVTPDGAGKAAVNITPPAGGLYSLEISDGADSRYCRLYAVPSGNEREELAAAHKAFAGGPLARPPQYAEIEGSSVFGSVREFVEGRRSAATEENKNDAALLDEAMWLIRSPLTPAVVIDAPAGVMRYFADQDIVGMGGPTHFAYQAGGAVKVVKGDAPEKLGGMTGNWILTWFNGAEGWDKITRLKKPNYANIFNDDSVMNIDYPHIILFAGKPESARLAGDDGLEVTLAQRTPTLCVPLYGCWKRFAEHTAEWGNGLPDDVVRQCGMWEKFLAYVPVDVREYYAIDPASGDVAIKDVYDFIRFKPGAGDLAAPAPPAAALAADCGAPIAFDDPVEDLHAATMMGPYKVVPGKSECVYRFKNFLKYAHEVEESKPGDPLDEQDWRAVELRGWMGDGLSYQFLPGDQNYYVYERAGRVVRTFPYLTGDKDDLRERARRYLYRVSRDYFVEPSCFTGGGASGNSRAINTSSEGGWGGDRCKHTTGGLYNVWQMAYYGGMWQMIADRWDLVRRMNSSEHTWLIPGPVNWAEHFHHGAGPGSIAAARMALVVGDMREYAYNMFLAAKIFMLEAAWIQGAAPYARERQPWNQSYQKDAIPVVLDTNWGFHFGGINENFSGPMGGAYDGIHENFWVWGTDELIRFWRDYLQPGTRHILDACDNRAHPGWTEFAAYELGQPGGRSSGEYWSLLKMKLLVLEEPENNRHEYMRKRAHYTLWTGPDGGTSLAHVLAALKNGYEYKQALPLPDMKPDFIRAGLAFGGQGWIEGGGPWRYSPEIKGAGIYNDTFIAPKPMEKRYNSIFAGFHRAWPRDADIGVPTITCGRASVQVWRSKE